MTTRVLPIEEWPRLVGTEAEGVIGRLSPAARVVVVEDGEGQIVGCHVLQMVLHAECLWVAPAHRGRSGVARRLWARVREEVQTYYQAGGFVTAAVDERVRTLLAHVGAQRLDAEFYAVPVKGAH